MRTNGQAEDGRWIIDSYEPPPGPLLSDRAGDGQAVQLWGLLGGLMTGLLGIIGLVNSFQRVNHAMQPSFGGLAWTVPVGCDAGIFGFTALDMWMAHQGLRTRWLRFVPWALVGIQVYLNVAGERDLAGAVAHAALPMLYVVAVEIGAHVIRHRAGLAGKGDQMDHIRLARWLLDPIPTVRLRRRMFLAEERSYTVAIDREIDSRIVRARWRDQYGWRWRWRVPKEQRVLYRYGRLTPADVVTEVPAIPLIAPDAPELPPATEPEPARPVLEERPPAPAAPDDEAEPIERPEPMAPTTDLMAEARQIAAEMGRVPGRPTMTQRLRAAGHSLSSDEAAEIVRKLKEESNGAAR